MKWYAELSLGLAVLTALLVFGCSDSGRGITEPTPPPSGEQAKGVIGPDGGTVGFDDGRFKLIIPAGALGSETEIVITELSGDDIPAGFRNPSVLNVYDLRPDGLRFAAPATAEANTEGSATLPEGAPIVGLVSLSRDTLELLATLQEAGDSDGIISSAPISHFSAMATVQAPGIALNVAVSPESVPKGGEFELTLLIAKTSALGLRNDMEVRDDIVVATPSIISLPREFDPPTFTLTTGEGQTIVRTATGTCIDVGRATVVVFQFGYQEGIFATLFGDFEVNIADRELIRFKVEVSFTCIPGPGSLGGMVTVDGEPTGGVPVIATALFEVDTVETVTAGDGTYALTELTARDYEVVVSCPQGTEPDASPKIATVTAGAVTTVDFVCTTPTTGGTGIVLAIGNFAAPSQPEAIFLLGGRDASQPGLITGGALAAANSAADFGPWSGNFLAAIAGANGYQIRDLAKDSVVNDDQGLAGGPYFGVVGASQNPPGATSPFVLFAFGANGEAFDRDGRGAFAGVTGFPTFDAYPAGGKVLSNIIPFVRPLREVAFWVWDGSAANRLYKTAPTATEFDDGLFQGELVSAYMHSDALGGAANTTPQAPFLVLTRGAASKLYLATWNPKAVTEVVADLGNDARKVRCIEAGSAMSLVCAVSVFGDDELGLLTWDGLTAPTLVGSVPVGDGPVGIDLALLGNGNVAVVSTGFNDNTVTETEVTPAGSVVSNEGRAVPGGCLNPGHATYVRDAVGLKVVGTCFGSAMGYVSVSRFGGL